MTARFERPASMAEARPPAGSGRLARARRRHRSLSGARRPGIAADPCSTSPRSTGLRGIRRRPDGWSIGAATTWTDLVRADLPPLFDGAEAGGARGRRRADPERRHRRRQSLQRLAGRRRRAGAAGPRRRGRARRARAGTRRVPLDEFVTRQPPHRAARRTNWSTAIRVPDAQRAARASAFLQARRAGATS